MVTILFLAGLVFLSSGLLSILNITNIGLDLVSRTRFHALPVLSSFSAAWVYSALGIILVQFAIGFSIRKHTL